MKDLHTKRSSELVDLPVEAGKQPKPELGAVINRETAKTYDEWLSAAKVHDLRTGGIAWRRKVKSKRYDWKYVQARLEELRRLRQANNPGAVLYYLNEGVHGNSGNIGASAMYTRALTGTKDLVVDYVDEITDAIQEVTRATKIPLETRIDFLERAKLCFGQPALMLSGGGSLGPFHIGVVKSLLEQELLPNVISGSSAGSMIAAIIGTNTDDDLRDRMGDAVLETYDEMRGAQGGKQGQITNQGLLEAIRHNIPEDLTFQEAFEKTGRRINITVSPREVHQTSRLLNAVTSPNVCIREAVQASCAVPGVFEPVTLMAKDYKGNRQPYVPGRQWVDGSVSDDLPAKRLARLYAANFFITSQTNPIVLWAVTDRGWDDSLMGRAWGIYQNASREWIRAAYPFVMDAVGQRYPYNYYARMAFSVALQDYTADVNIIPSRRLWDPRKLLSVLSESEIRQLILDGERSTWPKLEMIRTCTQVGRMIDGCLQELERRGARLVSG